MPRSSDGKEGHSWRPEVDRFRNRGVTDLGTSLARRLGHHVTATVPALVPLMLEDTIFHKSSIGLSHEVETDDN